RQPSTSPDTARWLQLSFLVRRQVGAASRLPPLCRFVKVVRALIFRHPIRSLSVFARTASWTQARHCGPRDSAARRLLGYPPHRYGIAYVAICSAIVRLNAREQVSVSHDINRRAVVSPLLKQSDASHGAPRLFRRRNDGCCRR